MTKLRTFAKGVSAYSKPDRGGLVTQPTSP